MLLAYARILDPSRWLLASIAPRVSLFLSTVYLSLASTSTTARWAKESRSAIIERVNSTVQLRAGTDGDVVAMYALDLLCFPEPFRFDLTLMRRLVCDPAGVAIVAEAGETLVGFVLAKPTRRRMRAYITTLDVHPGLRRSGLGGKLMAEAERRCLEIGATRMNLHVWTENAGAIGFYEASGYLRQGRVVGYYGSAGDAWVYRKGLAAGLGGRVGSVLG